jgi:hypothetical protein
VEHVQRWAAEDDASRFAVVLEGQELEGFWHMSLFGAERGGQGLEEPPGSPKAALTLAPNPVLRFGYFSVMIDV